jgi:hypothetical protein
MPLEGKHVVVCFIWLCAVVGYYFHDGSDPWVFAAVGTGLVLWLG